MYRDTMYGSYDILILPLTFVNRFARRVFVLSTTGSPAQYLCWCSGRNPVVYLPQPASGPTCRFVRPVSWGR